MIRSRSIPAVLSRATGNGIRAILLIDADGELLGSCGNPPPLPYSQGDNGGAAKGHSETNHWPLDAASIGALISEVARDYRHMGEDLLLLDPQYSQRQETESSVDCPKEGGVHNDRRLQSQQQQDGAPSGTLRDVEMNVDRGSSALQQVGPDEKIAKDKVNPDSGSNLKSLVIELDYGIVGVSSAGTDFYVIALADATVQHGALAGRLRSLGSHVREALSQLD